ncbi:hypothetical protein C4D60_Mb03t10900 [Musa balbisiana]|uniref:Uncharacterized protein n=1 Tax=Musa balbisiana TaxID=52838 RepID=A0A4S8J902_MUSBA|nr:hypothetical protein C4D60_Mb03t10900 [Musa balbisiana]
MASLPILSSMSLGIFLLIWSYFQWVTLGDNPSTKAIVSVPSSTAKLYIVDLGERQSEDLQLVTASHHDMLSSVLGRIGGGDQCQSKPHFSSAYNAKLGLPRPTVWPSANHRTT